jgi:threonine/homoserine/homoserine lactone efflux protein
LSAVLLDAAAGIRIGGGLLLLLIGVRAFRTAPAEAAEADDVVDDRRGLVGDYASTFLLTLANPVTILAFVGVFAALGVGLAGAYLDVAVLVAGVFAGSAFWWLCLAAVVDRFRAHLTPSHLRRVNQLAGVTIAGFGLLALWSAG